MSTSFLSKDLTATDKIQKDYPIPMTRDMLVSIVKLCHAQGAYDGVLHSRIFKSVAQEMADLDIARDLLIQRVLGKVL